MHLNCSLCSRLNQYITCILAYKTIENCFVSKTLLSLKAGTLRACNTLLTAIKKEFPVPGLRVEFSKGEVSSQLNGQCTSHGVYGMLEAHEY